MGFRYASTKENLDYESKAKLAVYTPVQTVDRQGQTKYQDYVDCGLPVVKASVTTHGLPRFV